MQRTDVGFAGTKQSKGRQRPVRVATLGLLVAGVVPAAKTDARQGLVALVLRSCASGVKRLRQIGVDSGYHGQWLCAWVRRVTQSHKRALAVVEPTGKQLQVVKHRGQVERTLAWFLNDRRHSRDYERLTVRSEVMRQISMIHLLLKRSA